jgi:hypothetical protein
MPSKMIPQRLAVFLGRAESDTLRLRRELEGVDLTARTQQEPKPLLRYAAEQLRTSARLTAQAAGCDAAPDEHEAAAALDAFATFLTEQGEVEAAMLLRDPDLRLEFAREQGWEEPAGAGADPYGRPSPQTHPEFWTE